MLRLSTSHLDHLVALAAASLPCGETNAPGQRTNPFLTLAGRRLR
jgi:hypothetical protein